MISSLLLSATLFFAFVAGELNRYESPIRDYVEVPNLKPVEKFLGIDNLDIQTTIRDDDGKVVFNFTSFPRLENIFEYMDYLHSKYSSHVHVFDIGSTQEGLPLRVIRVGPPYRPASTVWLDSGIHAREWITITSLSLIIHVLAERWTELSPAMRSTEFFLLPVVNPDGFRYSYTKNRMWRKNRRFTGKCYGVDLNRNFPYKWGTTHYLIKDGVMQQKKPCNEIYEGPIALSEAESRALVYFILGSGRKFQLQWEQREKQLLEENRLLKKNAVSAISPKEFQNFQSKIDSANETINFLKTNLNKVNEEWRKKETRLIHECEQLRNQLKNNNLKFGQPDVEKLQEQLKDTQEMNVKLKLDFESYKDKCTALENLCADLKKIMVDEQIAEKLYANDDTPAAVKQFLSSSPTSVLNTLTHMFGCLSRPGRNRPYCGQKDQSELFTTHESSMINDLSRSHEHHDLIRELLKEKDRLRKENVDLNRQVKELENIVRRRAHPNFSNVSEIIRNDESKKYEKESETVKNLKRELLDKQHVIIELKNQIIEAKATHDQNLLSLQAKLVNIQEESMKMKEEMEKNNAKKVVTATATTSTTTANHAPKGKRKGKSCDPPPHTARNFRVELSAKEREVIALNKQIDELKKTNRKLMKDKENNFLSSKEQSAENIQLNNKFAKMARENEKSLTLTKPDSTGGTKAQCPKQNIDQENQNLIPNNLAEISSSVDMKTPDTVVMNSPIDVQPSNCDAKSQNLQQVLCDLFKVLAKEESGDKIKNSNNDGVQSEEVRRFVAAFKNLST